MKPTKQIKRILLLIMLCASSMAPVFSQIEITTENKNDKILIKARSLSNATQTIQLKLILPIQVISSCGNSTVVFSIEKWATMTVCTLIPSKEASFISYNYSSTYTMGRYNTKPAKEKLYLLPATQDAKLHVLGNVASLTQFIKNIGQENATDSIIGINFKYSPADTICAVRSGWVVKIDEPQQQRPQDIEFLFDRPSTYSFTIEHKDGTLASYACNANVFSLVKLGDRVIAGQPIAVFSDEEDYSLMRFSIYYLTTLKDDKFQHAYLLPQFYTSNDGFVTLEGGRDYEAASTKYLIEIELTKQEKRKLK